MKRYKFLVMILCLSMVANIYLSLTICDLNENNQMLQTRIDHLLISSDKECIDYKYSDNQNENLIDAAILYQNKYDLSIHGLMIIIDDKNYNLGQAPEILEKLQDGSKIIVINDNIVEFTLVFETQTLRYKCEKPTPLVVG